MIEKMTLQMVDITYRFPFAFIQRAVDDQIVVKGGTSHVIVHALYIHNDTNVSSFFLNPNWLDHIECNCRHYEAKVNGANGTMNANNACFML